MGTFIISYLAIVAIIYGLVYYHIGKAKLVPGDLDIDNFTVETSI